MIARVGSALGRFSRRWVPDPFVLALLLTLVVLTVGAMRMRAAGEEGVLHSLAMGWADGFALTGGLAFALQMCFILITGHAMALSDPVQGAIAHIAKIPRSAGQASALVAFVACSSALVHWGLGAIAGALLAREIGRHADEGGVQVHYPMLGAAAYAGMAVWHGGLSGSAPLKVAAGDGAEWVGELSLVDLLLSPTNLVVCSALVVSIPLLFWAMTPRSNTAFVAAKPSQLSPLPTFNPVPIDSPVAWLQESIWPGRVLGMLGFVVLSYGIFGGVRKLEINTVNLLFLFVGMMMQGSLRRYVEAVADGARGAGAIILQFPLYFGILGVMKVSGMISWLSHAMVQMSTQDSFPFLAYASAGIVNLFVPSGGGQWGVQRDILLSSGESLGTDATLTVMAFAYGDAWTNMLQPFWALPLLGIMGLRARDIIGYTSMVFLLMALVVPLGLYLTM